MPTAEIQRLEEETSEVLEARQHHESRAHRPTVTQTVGVAKVTSIPRNCSDELPEFGFMYNDSEV